jgi:4-hydroxybenzoate polyprenyltransferase
VTGLRRLVRLTRPQQWIKNLAALAGVVFGGRLAEPGSVTLDLVVVVLFVGASAATYAYNDVRDVALDREHPRKRYRPVAAGEVSVGTARALAVCLAALALAGGVALGWPTFTCIALYLANAAAYSVRLKHVALLDVTSIAMGYVLRVLASIYVLGDTPTAWIVLCTFFLAVFLGFSKRQAEFVSAAKGGLAQRPVLQAYDLPLLSALRNSSATMAIMTYALFTATSGKNPSLIVTVPIVYVAIMHYLRRTDGDASGEEPERLLLQDPTILVSVLLWLVSFVVIFYARVHLFR